MRVKIVRQIDRQIYLRRRFPFRKDRRVAFITNTDGHVPSFLHRLV